MARQPRIEFSGALYHVMNRGIERREIFRDDVDRAKYLAIVEAAVARFRFRLYAFCLMGNHIHLALETARFPLSRIMRSINTRYAGYFNRRHRRAGYLFQGRYKALLVEKEEYLLTLIRYIHENPVRGGLSVTPGAYRWSSHRLYLRRSPKWLSSGEILGRFGRTRAAARSGFEAFFRKPEKRPYRDARRYVQTIVGVEDFAREILERAEPDADLIRRIEPENLIGWVARQQGIDPADLSSPSRIRGITRVRAICGYLAREVARMPISKIARVLGRDPSTLWRDVKYLDDEMKTSRPTRALVKEIQSRFVRWGNNT